MAEVRKPGEDEWLRSATSSYLLLCRLERLGLSGTFPVVSRRWLAADPRGNLVSHWCANRRTLFPDSSKPRAEREQLESRARSFEKIKIEGKNQIQEGQGAKERRESRRLIHKVAQR